MPPSSTPFLRVRLLTDAPPFVSTVRCVSSTQNMAVIVNLPLVLIFDVRIGPTVAFPLALLVLVATEDTHSPGSVSLERLIAT